MKNKISQSSNQIIVHVSTVEASFELFSFASHSKDTKCHSQSLYFDKISSWKLMMSFCYFRGKDLLGFGCGLYWPCFCWNKSPKRATAPITYVIVRY